MTLHLEPTGERMIVDEYKSSKEDYVIYLMHVATYDYALPICAGKRVLDYGCGSGYGSARIAEVAASVDAVDVAEDAVAFAQAKFGRDNLSFRRIDPDAPLPFESARFDVVLSFQVFEHVADTARYLSEIRRVLVPGGTLMLVTPDRSTRLLPLQKPWNRWHLHEYGADELARALSRHFDEVEMLGMSGAPDVIGVEVRRCARIKWMTLPLTLPFVPDRLRVAGLNLVHRFRRRGTGAGAPQAFDFGSESIHIAKGAAPSVNLVAIARATLR